MNLDELMPTELAPPPKPRAVPAGPGPIKTCPGCGAVFQRARFKYCDESCKEKARGRMARRILYVRAKNNRRYLEENPGVKPNNWIRSAPVYGEFLPGVSMAVQFDPGFVVQAYHAHLLHGMLTSILGKDHEPLQPAWRLFPVNAGSGWAVHLYDAVAASQIASRAWPGMIGKHHRQVTFIGRSKPRAPQVKRGKHVLRVTSLTPVCIRCEGEFRQRPTAENFVSSLRDRTCRHLGLEIPGEMICVKVLSAKTEVHTSPRLGDLNHIRGWSGEVDMECNATAAWLLKVAERCTGLGSKTAFGFGAIAVRDVVKS